MLEVPEAVAITSPTANPWPGLATYTEAAQASFKGRDEEIEELGRRVANARLTVLFGKSGLGKSSLILAGLFPRMRAQHLLPVYVRLELRNDRMPLVDQIRRALVEELRLHEVDYPPMEDGEGLWQYLHRRDLELWSRSNQLLTPVFVLDQFEEIFTHGESNPAAVAEFRSDLGNLAENGIPHELAARIEDNPELGERLDVCAWKYRILVSLREDFLPHLENWRRSIASLGGNRMRLLPMRRQQAFVAVYESAPHDGAGGAQKLVSKELAWKIVNHVSAASLRHAMTSVRQLAEKETQLLYNSMSDTAPTIEPALLSLFCAGLYQRWLQETGGGKAFRPFDDKLLEGAKEAIIEDFYRESIRDLPDRVAEFIETELITERGFRDSFPKEDAIQNGSLTEDELRTLEDRHLLRLEQHYGTPRIELTHDILTRAVREERDRRQSEHEHRELEERASEEKRKAEDAQRALQHYKIDQERIALLKRTRRQRAVIAAALGVAVVFLILSGVAVWQWRESNVQASRALSAKLALQAANMRDGREQGSLATALRLSIASLREFPGGDDGRRAVRLALDSARAVTSTVVFEQAPTAVAYSPDDRLLAVATRDRRIVLLDAVGEASTAKQLIGHTEPVRQMVFSPDGRTLASAGFDGNVILWDMQSFEKRFPPLRQKESLASVAFSGDGQEVLTGGGDELTVWNASSGKELRKLKGAGDVTFSVAYSADGQWIAAGTRGGKVRLWRVAQSAESFTISQPPEAGESTPVSTLAFSPDSRWLAAAGRQPRAMLIDLKTKQLSDVNIFQRDGLRALALSPDSRTLASASAAGDIALWTIPTGVRRRVSLALHQDAVTGLSFSHDGNRLASAGRDGSLIVWDLRHLAPLGEPLIGHDEGVLAAGVLEDSRTVVSVDRGGALLQWQLPGPDRGASLLRRDDQVRAAVIDLRSPQTANVRDVALSVNGRTAALVRRDGGLFLWPFGDSRAPIEVPLDGQRISDVAFSADGQMLAAINRANAVELWRVAPGSSAERRPFRMLGMESVKLRRAALSPDHRILATADSDNAIRFWHTDATEGTPPPPLAGHRDRILALAFGTDGKWLASAGLDRSIILWEVATGRPLPAPLQGHRDAIRSVAFSPDNSLLASAGDDETIMFWSLPSGEQLGAPLHIHSDSVRDLAFSPDGKWLISAGLDKQLVAWSLERLVGEGVIARFNTAESLKALCDKVAENLSAAEWSRYAGPGVPYIEQCPGKRRPS